MRILHTSDWHLGQHFIGRSRAAEHQKFFAWLLGQVKQQALNAIIVAGDVFDTATPPSYARELYNQFIVDLQPTGCQLVILGGNHDSPAVLAESKQLLAKLNTMVIPAIAADPADQLILLNDQQGSPGCLLAAIPYLRPRDLLQSQAGQTGQQKQQDLQQGMRAKLEVGQHAQFFQRINRQALRFVHHQQAAATFAGFAVQECLDLRQRTRLVVPGNLQPESMRADMDQFIAVQRRCHDLRRGQPLAVDRGHQVRNQRGFARADLAGDDDEALALVQAVLEVGHRPPVTATAVEEGGIGVELKGFAAKLEECFVHRFSGQNRMPTVAVTAFSV